MTSVLATVMVLAIEVAPAEGFLELNAGFVPVANDVPLMLGVGLRFEDTHELFGRLGYFVSGDDVGHLLGVAGYRLVLRPGHLVRPFVGALVAGLPATCTHDGRGRPSCSGEPLFILSALGGVRLDLWPWLSLAASLLLGADTYPNPFGMVELGATFSWPAGRGE